MSIERLSVNNGENEGNIDAGMSSLESMARDFDPVAAMEAVEERKTELAKEKAKEQLSAGASTVSVYIEGGASMSPKEWKKLKGEAGAYTLERQAWHERVLEGAIEAGKHLSEELGPPPRIIAARGGCGSGKTTAFKKLLTGKNVFDVKGDIPGAVKPDYFKDVIKGEARDRLGVEVTSVQAHMESTGICRMYSEKLIDDPEASMVIDKQLEAEGDIKELIEWGKKSNKPVELLDNDVPIELSAFRVLKRRIGGADPNIMFDGVARGFIGIRANRGQLLEDVRDEIVSTYSLRAFDPVSKKQIEVAKKVDGVMVYEPGYEELGRAIGRQDETGARTEAEKAKNQIITDEYIEEFVAKYFDESEGATKWSQEARNVLGAYTGLGITLGEALDSKAAGINPDRDKGTNELMDPRYREKVVAFVQQKRAGRVGAIA